MNITITKLPLLLLTREINRKSLLVFGLLFLALWLKAQPSNNDCSTATVLFSSTECVYQTYTLANATFSSNTPVSSCLSNHIRDVWFKTTIPVSGVLAIQAKSNVNPIIAISTYTGSCGALSYFNCTNSLETGKNHLTLTVDDPGHSGEDIYIMVTRGNSSIAGDFELCVYNQELPANDEVEDAVLLTNTTGSFQHSTYSNRFAAASAGVPTGSCGTYLGGDTWFKTIVPPSGDLVVHATSTEINPRISMYTGTVGSLTYKTCSTLSIGEAEIQLSDVSLADETVYLRVYADNNDKGGSFDIAVLEPTQDVCSDAIVLNGNKPTEEFVYYTNKYASATNDGPTGLDPSCGSYMNTDIWFEITVPGSGELIIDSKASSAPSYSVKPVLTAYTGTCNNLTELVCNQFGSSNTFGAKISIVPADNLANQTIFLRMHNYNSSVGGTFELSVHNPAAALPVDLVRFSAVANDDEVALDWSTASEENNAYFLVEHSVDGRYFIPVGEVKGNGTTSELQHYTYVHGGPYYGANYYRLKQVDLDGAFEYSHVVVVQIRLLEEQFKLFPNPVYTNDVLTLRWSGDLSREKLEIAITNALGRPIYRQQVLDNESGEATIHCGQINMDAGIYFLQLSTDRQVIAHRRFNLIVD